VEEETAKEMARDDEDMDDGEPDTEKPELLPIRLQGCWRKCKVRDAHVLALEKEGTVAPRAES
jgi:hypothetical protein